MTPAKAIAKLNALGSTAGEVADSLRRLSIRGRPRYACDCPIARLLGATEVGTRYFFVGHISAEMPIPVCDFIRAFDGGAYPDLVST